jgi:hypothetical protein
VAGGVAAVGWRAGGNTNPRLFVGDVS